MSNEKIKILIVEDDPIIALDIKSLLQQNGYLVIGTALNALKAYDILHSNRPDMAILDIHLGTGPNGIEIAEVIHEKYKIPFIFLTSFSDPVTLEAAQEQGPFGYLVKPFQEQTLLTTIATAWNNFQRFHKKKTIDFTTSKIPLTPKESEICAKLLEGDSYKTISIELDISINTLKFHAKNIYTKFDINSRAELTALLLNME